MNVSNTVVLVRRQPDAGGRGIDDREDEAGVVDARAAGGLREAGVVLRLRQDARQRVHLEEERFAGRVAADVDAAPA